MNIWMPGTEQLQFSFTALLASGRLCIHPASFIVGVVQFMIPILCNEHPNASFLCMPCFPVQRYVFPTYPCVSFGLLFHILSVDLPLAAASHISSGSPVQNPPSPLPLPHTFHIYENMRECCLVIPSFRKSTHSIPLLHLNSRKTYFLSEFISFPILLVRPRKNSQFHHISDINLQENSLS